jgi:hypothetical protein
MTWWTDDKGAIASEQLNPDFRLMTPTEEAARQADEAARLAAHAALKADLSTLRADAALKALMRSSPAQIDAWVAANVTDLASARNAIRLLARAVSVVARNVLES